MNKSHASLQNSYPGYTVWRVTYVYVASGQPGVISKSFKAPFNTHVALTSQKYCNFELKAYEWLSEVVEFSVKPGLCNIKVGGRHNIGKKNIFFPLQYRLDIAKRKNAKFLPDDLNIWKELIILQQLG